MTNAKKTEKSYFDKVHRWGKISMVSALAVMFLVPLMISIYYSAWPDMTALLTALASVVPVYWGAAIAEVISYTPLLGAGGTYLSFVTGNISNLKLPCGVNALENAGVRSNSEEGEVISTLAIGASSITTTLILAVGVLLFSPFLSYLTSDESVVSVAFEQVLPALFGALGASYFVKHWKISIFPILVGVIVLIFAPTLAVGTLLFITLIASLLGAFVMIKLKLV